MADAAWPVDRQEHPSQEEPANDQHPDDSFSGTYQAHSSSLPEVYDPQALPEVDQPQAWLEAVKFHQRDAYPEHVGTPNPAALSSSRIPKWKRKWVIATLAILFFLLVAGAAVGGILGSRAAAAKNSTYGDSNPTPTGVSTSPSTSPSVSPAPDSRFPGAPTVVASVNVIGGYPTMQLMYQTNTSGIFYRLYLTGTSFEAERQLNLSIPPKLGAALSLCSRTDAQGNSLLSLFYTDKSGNRTDIIRSEITCQKASPSCVETSSANATANAQHAVHLESKLASLWLGGQFTFRTIYQTLNGSLVQLAGDNGKIEDTLIGPGVVVAVNGSAIATTLGSGPDISISYLAEGSMAPTEVTWKWNGGLQNPILIDGSPSASWNPTAPLAACYESIPDIYNFYYVTPETGTIISYTRSGSSSEWSRFGASTQWPTADRNMAALGWFDNIRLFYTSKGVIEQPLLGNGTWFPTQIIP